MCIYEALDRPLQRKHFNFQADKSVSSASIASTSSTKECFAELESGSASPPSYDTSSSRDNMAAAGSGSKKNFFGRMFSSRKSKQTTAIASPPSYRDTEVSESWAKVGINVNDRSQGPMPQCTPQEWAQAMDDFFGPPVSRN